MPCSLPITVLIDVPDIPKEDLVLQVKKDNKLTGWLAGNGKYVEIFNMNTAEHCCYTYDEFLNAYGGYDFPLPELPADTPIPEALLVDGELQTLLIKEYLRQPMTPEELARLSALKSSHYRSQLDRPWLVPCSRYTKPY